MKRLLGNTYNYRLKIKAEGGVWNQDEKAWFVPDEKYDQLQKMVNSKMDYRGFDSDRTNMVIHNQLRSWTC